MDGLPRKERTAWNHEAHAHFVTYSCFKHMPLLQNDRARGWVLDALEGARRSQDLAIWAYVIMPEHVHVLLCPRRPEYEMRQILAALKRPVAAAARRHMEESGQTRWLARLTVESPSKRVFRFWQPGGGFDRNVVYEKTAESIIRYIHMNPVRRGLVEKPLDWKWSSAGFWEGREDALVRMDRPGE
ncbi:MAG: transposase [Planctomycetota bacterium]|nr:transposase [Planctomycetota bacterium]